MDEFLDNLEEIAEDAFAEIVAQYNIHVDEVIESLEAFNDLGFTEQDIVDTGRLRDSKLVQVEDNLAEFEWSPRAPKTGFAYAPLVWAGFMAYGKKYVPGRHWPERAAATLNNHGVTTSFVEALKQRGLDAEILVNGDEDLDT